MKNKVLAMLLALCMVMSLLPATMLTVSAAGADGEEPEESAAVSEAPEESEAPVESTAPSAAPTPVPTCGTCGCSPKCEDCASECGCATRPCGKPGCTFVKCGDKTCQYYGTYHEAGNHTEDLECNPNLSTCSKDKDTSGHELTCPTVCKDVPGCTKGQGHTGAHEGTNLPCTGDEKCGADKHAADCKSDAAVEASAAVTLTPSAAVTETVDGVANVETKRYGKTTVILERLMKAYFDCTCVNEAHASPAPSAEPTDAPCTATVEVEIPVKIKVEVQYEWTVEYVKDQYGNYVKDNGALVENANVTAANKAAAEKAVDPDPEASAYDTAFTNALSDAEDVYELQHPNLICEDCEDHQVVAEVKVCTMARNCPADTHEDNCLKLCTGDKDCPNDAGVATAHQVTYVIVKTTLASGDTAEAGSYDAKSLAAAEAKALNAIEKAKETAEFSYVVVAVYCPAAGIPDSVVVTADGEDVEEPTDTTDEAKVPEKAEDFADLKGDEWYAEELTELIEKGIFIGSKNAEGKYAFNSTGNVTLKEMVVLLSRVAGEDLVTTGDGATWFVAALNWATEAGLVEGVEDGTLARKDVVLTLWRLAGSPEVEDAESVLADFEDAAELEGDHLTAMAWAVSNEIIKGDGDTGLLKTDDNITRAEMVTVLNRYSKLEK